MLLLRKNVCFSIVYIFTIAIPKYSIIISNIDNIIVGISLSKRRLVLKVITRWHGKLCPIFQCVSLLNTKYFVLYTPILTIFQYLLNIQLDKPVKNKVVLPSYAEIKNQLRPNFFHCKKSGNLYCWSNFSDKL